jgi:hypothetical protein
MPVLVDVGAGDHKEMSSILADQKRPCTYMRPTGGGGEVVGPMSTAVQINFGDLTPHLTYGGGAGSAWRPFLLTYSS